jgi:hypothetical protein
VELVPLALLDELVHQFAQVLDGGFGIGHLAWFACGLAAGDARRFRRLSAFHGG